MKDLTPEEAFALLDQNEETVFVKLASYTYHRIQGDRFFYYFAYGSYPECLRTMDLPGLDYFQERAQTLGQSWEQWSEAELIAIRNQSQRAPT